MLNRPSTPPQRGHGFRIRIAGIHSDQWSGRFAGVELQRSPEGDSLLTGAAVDEAALFGILRTIESLGARLISICAYPADGGRG